MYEIIIKYVSTRQKKKNPLLYTVQLHYVEMKFERNAKSLSNSQCHLTVIDTEIANQCHL